MSKIMNKVDMNYKWFEENKKELLKKYKDEYVVIHNQKVVFNSDVFEKAVTYASELELGTFIIQKVEKEDTIQVFHTRTLF